MAAAPYDGFTSYCTERNYEEPGEIKNLWQLRVSAWVGRKKKIHKKKQTNGKKKLQNASKSTDSGIYIQMEISMIKISFIGCLNEIYFLMKRNMQHNASGLFWCIKFEWWQSNITRSCCFFSNQSTHENDIIFF